MENQNGNAQNGSVFYEGVRAKKIIRIKAADKKLMDKETACLEWAEAFGRFGIEFMFKPEVVEDGKTYCPDFYLKGSDVFVIVKGIFIDEDKEHFDAKVSELAYATERDIIVCYKDGKMKMADYTDHVERLEYDDRDTEAGKPLYLDSEVMMCACGYCEQWYFQTNCSGWGCRVCGKTAGDGSWDYLHHGENSIFELSAKLKGHRRKNPDKNALSVRELIYEKGRVRP